MIEIIALIFLARRIGNKAILKNQPKGRWQLYVVLAWIGFEIVGAVIGMLISGDLILAALLGLGTAVGGYLLVDHRLSQFPDKVDETWIDRLGKQDEI